MAPATIGLIKKIIHHCVQFATCFRAFLTQSGPPELKKQLSKAHKTHNQSGQAKIMQKKITSDELDYILKKRNEHGRPLGPAPIRRRNFGFYTPSEKYEAILNRLLKPESNWLDLGGGRYLFPENPALAIELSKRCSRVVGIDPSPNIEENQYINERFQGFLDDFKGQRNFDVISLRMVAEHIQEPQSIVSQISKSIKVGGFVVILTVWDYAPITWISRLTPHWVHFPIKKVFWGGEEKDTFPVAYKMNSLSKLRKLFGDQGFTTEMLELVADCSTTSKWQILNTLELSAWKALSTLNVPYPESCVLAVFRKHE